MFTFDVKYMTKQHGALLSSHLFVVVFISDTMSRFAAVTEEDGVQIIADKYAKNAFSHFIVFSMGTRGNNLLWLYPVFGVHQ